MTAPLWHFLNSDSGGVARYVERLAAAQCRRGDRPLRVAGSPALALPAGVRRDAYAPYRAVWGLNQWRFALRAGWLIARERGPAVIHAHNVILADPAVYTAHGLYTEYVRRAAERDGRRRALWQRAQTAALAALERRMLQRARQVVFVSADNRAFAEDGLGVRRPGHFHVLGPGVDPERYSPALRVDQPANRRRLFPEVEAGRRWLLFVGHDYAGKGLLRLLESLACRPEADWALLIFGRDPAGRARVQALAQTLPARVHVFDDDARLPAAYGLADCLVLDSAAEGFPLVLLEAMAAGCVPAVTRFGGAAAAVTDGVNGWLAGSAGEVVARVLTAEAGPLRAMSARAVQAAAGHTWERLAAAYADIYREAA